jgi:hypothetical protein
MEYALVVRPHINNGGLFKDSIACNPPGLSCTLTMKQHAPHHYSYAGTVSGKILEEFIMIFNIDIIIVNG